MESSSVDVGEMARKNLSAILQRLSSVGQNTVAQALSTSEASVSRMKEKEVPDLSKMLAVLGLKCVPTTVRCFNPVQLNAILLLAKERLAQIESVDQLVWEDNDATAS